MEEAAILNAICEELDFDLDREMAYREWHSINTTMDITIFIHEDKIAVHWVKETIKPETYLDDCVKIFIADPDMMEQIKFVVEEFKAR